LSLPIDLKILLALLERDKLSKRELDRYIRVHPKLTQNHLKRLVKEGVVREEGEHIRGKKLFYSLTSVGKEKLATQAVNYLNAAFRSIQKITNTIVPKQAELKRFRESLKDYPPLIITSKIKERGYFTKQEIDKHMEDVERIHGPLTEAYKNMRQIFLEVWGVRLDNGELQDVAIATTKEGRIYMIPVSMLKAHSLGVGL